jgi:hypothetical protein
VKYLSSNGANTSELKRVKFRIKKTNIESLTYKSDSQSKKGNEKWNKLPNDIWFYILNEFFDKEYEQTNQLLKLSKVSKLFYNRLLLSSELNMNNFIFSLKPRFKLNDIVNKIKPNYRIRNLSLICVKDEITNEDLKYLTDEKYFNLYKLDISFCKFIDDESFDYFSNIKVLEMVACDQIETKKIKYLFFVEKSGISNKGLSKLRSLRELNMIACDQKTINDEVFKSIGNNLVKLNISCCYQFTNEIFNYLSSKCEIKMNKLDLKRN